MIEKEVRIMDPAGLHTRPAKQFVDAAKKYACDVTLIRDTKEGSGKNLIKLMKLGISCGTVITLRCDGADEKEACEKLGNILVNMKG
ncbi:MAG: HPr family phosphocarrier protein [Treponema sp.]|jgi:phosphotransferase system HPr (HPr) family protein|nr:HPr family phosphocarrier protein [Treponema sp.]